MLAALLLAAIFGLPGLLVFSAARARGADPWPWPRGVAVALALGVAIAGLGAIALGAASSYSLVSECVVLTVVGALCFAFGRFRLAWPFTRASRVESAGFVLVGGLAAAMFCGHPFEMLLGERDATVYTVSGIGLARQGSLLLRDVAAEQVGVEAARQIYPLVPGQQDGWLRLPQFVKYPGFYYADSERKQILTQGLAFLPAIIAIFYGAFGVTGAFVANNVLGVFAVLAVFAAGVSLVGEVGALLGASVLALNLVEVWAARYPVAEILLQMLFFASYAALLRGDRLGQGLAGFLLGATLFAKIEAALVLVPIAAFAIVSLVRRRSVAQAPFWTAFGATVIVALLYWVGFQPGYVTSESRRFSFWWARVAQHFFEAPGAWSLAGLLVVAVIVPLGLAMRSRFDGGLVPLAGRVAAAVVIAFGIFGYWVRPQLTGFVAGQPMTLVWLGWYLTPAVLVLGFAGLALHLATKSRAETLVVLAVALTLAGVFLQFTFVNLIHPYLTRRFVPAAVPVVCLFFGYAVAWLATLGQGRWRVAATLVAAVLFLGSTAAVVARSRHLYSHREYPGLERQLAELADDLRGADLVLLGDGKVRNLFGATLEFVYGLPTIVWWPRGYVNHADLVRAWLAEPKSIRVLTSTVRLEEVPGAEDFDFVAPSHVDLRALRQVADRFPGEFEKDRVWLSRYAAGRGSHPLYEFWRKEGARVTQQICGSRIRLLDGDPFLVQRIRARCPSAVSAEKNFAVLAGDDTAEDWQKTLALYGARFVRHDLGGVVVFDGISPQPSSGARLSADRWTLEASDGRGSEALAVDGRLDTRWASRAPLRPGMTFRVEFPEPTDVRWARIRMGRLATDRPRGLSFETSVDGIHWDRRDVPTLVDGLRWNADVPEENANGDVDLWVNARAIRFLRLVNRGERAHFDWSIAELEIEGRPSAKP